MHIDRADQITMASEAASAAHPISLLGFMFMPTSGTLATGSSFRTGEARDVSLFGFVGQIINVFAILPLGHTLIMMPTIILVTDAMGIADEERANVVLDTEVDDLARGFMPQITDTPFVTLVRFVLGPLQLFPSSGILLAVTLLPAELSQLLIALPLKGTDTPSCHDQGLFCIRRHCCQVDFA
jgi:hypothetical protein